MARGEPPLWQVAHCVTGMAFVRTWRIGRPAFSRFSATSADRDLPSSAYGMWQAAQPVARKFPLRAFARVQRWQEVHSFLRRSKKTSPDSLNVGSGSSLLRAPRGGPPPAQGAGGTGNGVIAQCTRSRAGLGPF